MELKMIQKEIQLQSRGWIPTIHDITADVHKIVGESGILNGTVSVVSHHTTCSVMIQECSHDFDTFDLVFLQHDLLDIMREMIPDYVNEPGNFTSMNTDGHLRSVFFGRSETLTIKDGKLDLGEFAHVYFIDWDHVRARHRQCNVTIIGTTEDVGDRKYNGGEVVNTLRKFPAEEKAYMEQYDEWKKR